MSEIRERTVRRQRVSDTVRSQLERTRSGNEGDGLQMPRLHAEAMALESHMLPVTVNTVQSDAHVSVVFIPHLLQIFIVGRLKYVYVHSN